MTWGNLGVREWNWRLVGELECCLEVLFRYGSAALGPGLLSTTIV